MKDAIGGVFSTTAIIVALLVIMCLMAFAVNYSKAFRVKNEIRSIIEKNNGFTEGITDLEDSAEFQITDLMRRFNYYIDESYDQVCRDNGYDVFVGRNLDGSNAGVRFCIKCTYADNVGELNKNPEYRGAYYSIMTFVDLDLPIINKLVWISGDLFSVKGETAIIYDEHNNRFCHE